MENASAETAAPKRRRVKKTEAPAVEAVAPQPVEAEVPAEAEVAKPKRTRKTKAAEPVVEVPASAPANVAFLSPPAETIAEAEPAATAEPALAPEPDPAEISTPPEKPKRGWWRGRG